MSNIEVVAGEKFALIAIPETHVTQGLQDAPYAKDLWATRRLPFPVADYWKKWIGSIRFKQLERAQLLLLTKGQSNTPNVLDSENQEYKQRIFDFYFGLLVTRELMCSSKPFLLSGGNEAGHLSIKEMGDLERPFSTGCSRYNEIDCKALKEAAQLADAIAKMRSYGDSVFKRVWKVLSVFRFGISNQHVEERLHDFCRCIDGLIQSRRGKGKSDFCSRASLFIGSSYDDLMAEMYDIRNEVEHMRDPETAIICPTIRDKRIKITERSMQAEAVTRYCVKHLLLNELLWQHFEDKNALEKFWNLSDGERRELWGNPLNFSSYANCIDPNQVTDSELGLC